MNEELPSGQNAADLSAYHLTHGSAQLPQWTYQVIRPYLKGKVLEIGSGKGYIASLFVREGFALRISDSEKSNCEILQSRFSGDPIIKGVHQLDMGASGFETRYMKFIERFDTIVSIAGAHQNIDNPLELRNAKKLLRQRGYLIALLPAHFALYGESDSGFRQWRRLNRWDISHRVGKDCEIIKTQFFTIADNPTDFEPTDNDKYPGADSENLYHQYVPSFRLINEPPFHQAGLFVFTVARKI